VAQTLKTLYRSRTRPDRRQANCRTAYAGARLPREARPEQLERLGIGSVSFDAPRSLEHRGTHLGDSGVRETYNPGGGA